MNDLKFAFRQLLKNPGFTAIALLTLALGVGVNTSMFSLLSALLFHQPAYPEPDVLIRVFRSGPNFQGAPHSAANFLDLQARTKMFSHVAAFRRVATSYAEPGQPAEQWPVLTVSGDFFATIGVQPALGRALTSDDDQPGLGDVIVLSDITWRQRFAADPGIVGRTIRLDGMSVTVVGVMPTGFDDRLVWGQVAAWRPLALGNAVRADRGDNYLSMIGRLRAGATEAQAQAEMNTLWADLARTYPETNAGTILNLTSFVRSTQDQAMRTLSILAMGLAACVLLIACANLANLLFARNIVRARERAIRTALGASRARLIRQSLVESLLLALGGGMIGLLCAAWRNASMGAGVFVGGQPLGLALDWRIAGFAFAVALLAAAIFGLLPAILASRTNVNETLKQGTRGSTSASYQRLRRSLIVAEVSLAFVLLSGAGFFIRGLDRFLARDQGWRPDGLLTASISLPTQKYADDATLVAFYDRLRSRVSTLPGVDEVSLSRTLPFFGFGFGQRFIVEGQPKPDSGTEPQRDVNGVGPEYFKTMGIDLVEGRAFTFEDINGPVRTYHQRNDGSQVLARRKRHWQTDCPSSRKPMAGSHRRGARREVRLQP